MIREVDLVSYLPPFMQSYKEPVAALGRSFAGAWIEISGASGKYGCSLSLLRGGVD